MGQTENDYIEVLEEKIVELSLKLKGCTNNKNEEILAYENLVSKLLHDVKNPIGVVYSFSEMILNSDEQMDPDKLKRYIGIVNESAGYSIKILNSFATYKQVHSVNFKLNLEKCNYIELLNEVIDSFKEIASNKGILIKNCIAENNIFLNIDKNYLKIALSNILNNSIRYSNENSEVNIEVAKNNGNIETIISDLGVGISEECVNMVFEPFFTENTKSNNNEKCTGLGLPVAQKIIKLHNAKVSIISEKDKGTQVKVVFRE
ncbi:sensor histidine kinase [Lutibacter citreus]|uniref:sensor histidine kinase n=1 Tax=Lutibacter citreus TaxID=2138210 RepID=UPI000DBE3BEE|nr:HAMP domain-containing sensor histidine kinase [Lutibacter citreus]